MNYKRRQTALRAELGNNLLDGLLVTHLANVRYLCGFTGSAGALLLTEEESVFFSDGRYKEQARAEVKSARTVIGRMGPLDGAAAWMTEQRKKVGAAKAYRLGIESEHMTVASRRRLAAGLPSGFRLREAPALVESARMMKDEDEIRLIRSAVEMGAGLFETALKTIKPGVRESEVAAEMEYAARSAGGEQMAFSTIVASGKRSALPHGRASEATIPRGAFVVCDFGVILAGYCSDRTRTAFVGRPTMEARRVYRAVLEAQLAGIDTVRPGVTASEVDDATRKILRRNGLASRFTHSTGHGVGLEIHESPRLAARQTQVLRAGMVITIEPGVYFPGKWGVRIEDMVVVRKNGCEVLTPTSKELIAI